ncbi:PAS domain-containing protein [Caballeronia arationis]|uniref:PAS domain-containing protein n=1 Tax=Caballeronia arationis TaxID=1777142 RepID=UPI000B34F5C1
MHEEDRSRVEASLTSCVLHALDFAEEYRVTTAEQGERWLFARGRSYGDARGTETRFPGVGVDVEYSTPK